MVHTRWLLFVLLPACLVDKSLVGDLGCTLGSCPDEARITLDWDTSGADLDLHFAEGDAALFAVPGDCSYCNPAPDWGEEGAWRDDPAFTQDSMDGDGPEVIEITEPADGSYAVRVHYFDDDSGNETTAAVSIRVGDDVVYTAEQLLWHNQVWVVGHLRMPEGDFTPDGDLFVSQHRSCFEE